MGSRYAQGTSVPIDRSKAELERCLVKYGADQCATGWSQEKAVVTFRMNNRHIRVLMPLDTDSTPKAAQENRRRWRALVLYVKAKLESVESEIVSFENAFMAHIVLPGGGTVGEVMKPQIEHAYQTGKMPPLLGYDG
jgi:hypothetical protein